jgi:hypothetical protein
MNKSEWKDNLRDRFEVLENLMDELLKEEPREEKIRGFMEQSGMEYIADPVDRLNYVLQSLDMERPPNPTASEV